ncbi:RNA-binding protein with serine-rich domain 1-like [Palaemon carinicauda]|uniref:RNA-binding protein with serine-rich domain 1-like n=1 Tax=Palaemon carinicauda TaxID=392227 RepID=UPI0035B5BF44
MPSTSALKQVVRRIRKRKLPSEPECNADLVIPHSLKTTTRNGEKNFLLFDTKYEDPASENEMQQEDMRIIGFGTDDDLRKLASSQLEVDPHSLCSSCRGKVCSPTTTCSECESWGEIQWVLYGTKKKKAAKKSPKKANVSSSLVSPDASSERGCLPSSPTQSRGRGDSADSLSSLSSSSSSDSSSSEDETKSTKRKRERSRKKKKSRSRSRQNKRESRPSKKKAKRSKSKDWVNIMVPQSELFKVTSPAAASGWLPRSSSSPSRPSFSAYGPEPRQGRSIQAPRDAPKSMKASATSTLRGEALHQMEGVAPAAGTLADFIKPQGHPTAQDNPTDTRNPAGQGNPMTDTFAPAGPPVTRAGPSNVTPPSPHRHRRYSSGGTGDREPGRRRRVLIG